MSLLSSFRTARRVIENPNLNRSLHGAFQRSMKASRQAAETQSMRSFSSLLRPPSLRGDYKPKRPEKLRQHAVSLDLGDYSDPLDKFSAASGGSDEPSWEDDEMEVAQEVLKIQEEKDAQKERWMNSAKPPVRAPIIDERGRAYGRGGRKTASARVWIQPGFGNVTVNKKDFLDYFDRTSDRDHILSPLAATFTCGKFDVTANVQGGGLRGQAGAIRHGLARAMNAYNPDAYRPALKRLGFLTRDPRRVERKKIGHVKARKKPQWVKR